MKSVFMLSVVIFYGFLMGRSQQIEKFAALDTISMGARWLDSVDVANNEQHGFQVAAAHNTGATGSNGWYATFVNKAQSLGKEAWNTELHKWVGADSMRQEIMTSDIFWRHLRAGFTGIDTWLFFGPYNGKGHTMVWARPDGAVRTSGKYEIFKQVVNNANGGKYVKVSRPSESSVTAAFIKNDILSVWILNKDSTALEDLDFDLASRDISGETIEVIKWHGGLGYENGEQAGESSSFVATEPNRFTFDIDSESLYFFKIDFN